MAQPLIRIATRRSPLAMWQAEYVKQLIETNDPGRSCALVPMTTSGDANQSASLQTQGGKGLFLKELEIALVQEEADIAVHSMKDVPVQLADAFALSTVGERGSVHDVIVSPQPFHSLSSNATIGTSSNRRRALLAHVFKRSKTAPVRGNVQSRLRKLDDGEVDALVLAEAGLTRLGLDDRKREVLPPDTFVPAPGQGALAVEYLGENEDIAELVQTLQNQELVAAVNAERFVAEALGADCAGAFGAHCQIVDDAFRLRAVTLSQNGDHAIYAQSVDSDARAVAERVAQRLQKQGAGALLEAS